MAKNLGEPKAQAKNEEATKPTRTARARAASKLAPVPKDSEHGESNIDANDKAEPTKLATPKSRKKVPAKSVPPTTRKTRAQAVTLEGNKDLEDKAKEYEATDEAAAEPETTGGRKKLPAKFKLPPVATTRVTRAQSVMAQDKTVANRDETKMPPLDGRGRTRAATVVAGDETVVEKDQQPKFAPAEGLVNAEENNLFDCQGGPKKTTRGQGRGCGRSADKVTNDEHEVNGSEAIPPTKLAKPKRGRPKRGQPAAQGPGLAKHARDEAVKFSYDQIKPRTPLQKTQQPLIKQEEVGDNLTSESLDQYLATLSLGKKTLGKADVLSDFESPESNPKANESRGRPRKVGASVLDMSGLNLTFTYFSDIRDLAMTGDVADMEKMCEMAEQGMETVQACLDAARDEYK